MAGMVCFTCGDQTNDATPLHCERTDCPARAAAGVQRLASSFFFHVAPSPDACAHQWGGWRNFEDGRGGEQVCRKCGIGAMAYTLRTGP